MIRDIQGLFEAGPVGDLADGQLLERFVAGREAAVFEALVRRHGPMVWGVCRRVLRDHHDAEDAFQATFLVLARRAAAVVPREKVGPWLHGVASQTALKARATRARRRGRDRENRRPLPVLTDPDRDDRLDDLDREISRLPARYRVPIVLCELEGKTHREAADQLGWPIGTVSGRLSRARALLAQRLTRPALLDHGVPWMAIPPQWVVPARLMHFAGYASPTSAGSVSAEVAALTRGVIRMMWLSKVKTSVMLSLGVALAVGATGMTYQVLGAAEPTPPPVAPAAAEAPVRPEVAPLAVAPAPVAPLPPPPAPDPAPPVDPTASYPYTVDATEVYEFPALQISYGNFKLKADGPVQVLPMKTERGIAGAMLLGTGDFEYAPEPGKTIAGHQRAVMLRFNSDEQAAILPLDKATKVSDQGAAELSRHLLSVVVNHCYHRGRAIMIPAKGAFAAVLYTREHGDLLISFDAKVKLAYNFTTKVQLYDKK